MKLDNRTPYTYLIGWKKLNVWYYGVRYARNCHPRDFWKSYFTSSTHVNSFVAEHGDPDVIKIRKVFDNIQLSVSERITKARTWESTVLKRLKVVQSENWLNRTDIMGPVGLPGELNPMYGVDRSGEKNTFYGKHHTLKSKLKMSRTRSGVKTRSRSYTTVDRRNLSISKKKAANKHKLYHNEYGDFYGSLSDLAEKYPDQRLRKDELWRLTIGYNKSYKGWIMSSVIVDKTPRKKKGTKMNDKIILTDVDGVLLGWEYAFDTYLSQHGFKKVEGGQFKYDIGKRYGIDYDQGVKLIKLFNESAAIGFLPPLRDSIYYVKKLHEKHGYVFHAITSLSKDKNSQELRKMNLRKLFGETTFEEFIFLDTGEPKDDVLLQYRDTGYWWIEDKITNAIAGQEVGLKSILVEHGHNLDFAHPEIPLVKNWQEIYQLITDETD